ncbi:MAG: UDP-2,3-diacylglucosamine diphosphatase [Planctomycetota bacterium]
MSDVHLGSRGARARELGQFLDAHACDQLYLVGDILDGWKLRRGWYWDDAQTEIVQRFVLRAAGGTRVTYVPGNHDEGLRAYGELSLAGIEVVPEVVHTAADGKRYLVLHGDRFDAIVRSHRWLADLGDRAYSVAIFANRWLNALQRLLRRPQWSLSGYLKGRVKDAFAYAEKFEQAIVTEAQKRRVDGVICGHIHKAELRAIDGVLYANDGDWVDSCTALIERYDGVIELVRWTADSGTCTREASTEAAVEVSAG